LKGENTIGIINYFYEKGYTYIVQKYCDGGDLRSYLLEKERLEEDHAIEMFNQVLKGMKELRQLKYMH